MANKIYLGISGSASHPNDVADRYNKLLDYVGYQTMLAHMERSLTTEELRGIIKDVEEDLKQDGIDISEDFYLDNE